MNFTNPYVDENNSVRLIPSVVAFLDILGFREQTRKAERDGDALELLTNLKRALDNATRGWMRRETAPKFFEVRAFTDNLVIGVPIILTDDGEGEIGTLFELCSYYQLDLSLEGFFVRGAIGLGNLYMDDVIVYGQSLIDTYEAEAMIARDPRIILTDPVVEAARGHLRYYAGLQAAPHYTRLLEDADGQIFLSYLDVAYDDQDSEVEVMSRHKEVVLRKLEEFADQPRVWSKYAWVGAYHNFICSDHALPKELKVPQRRLSVSPKRINWPAAKKPSKRQTGVTIIDHTMGT